MYSLRFYAELKYWVESTFPIKSQVQSRKGLIISSTSILRLGRVVGLTGIFFRVDFFGIVITTKGLDLANFFFILKLFRFLKVVDKKKAQIKYLASNSLLCGIRWQANWNWQGIKVSATFHQGILALLYFGVFNRKLSAYSDIHLVLWQPMPLYTITFII